MVRSISRMHPLGYLAGSLAMLAFCAVASAFLVGLLNLIVFESEIVDAICSILLVIAANLALAIPAGHMVNLIAARGKCPGGALASVLIVMLLLATIGDYLVLNDVVGSYSESGPSALVSLSTILACTASFVFVWAPFAAQPRYRYSASVASLVLSSITVILFFVIMAPEVFGQDAGAVALFGRFALMVVSLSSAISGFLVQRQSRRIS